MYSPSCSSRPSVVLSGARLLSYHHHPSSIIHHLVLIPTRSTDQSAIRVVVGRGTTRLYRLLVHLGARVGNEKWLCERESRGRVAIWRIGRRDGRVLLGTLDAREGSGRGRGIITQNQAVYRAGRISSSNSCRNRERELQYGLAFTVLLRLS